MAIIWPRVSSPNLVCSTEKLMQEKPHSQMAVLLLIVIGIPSKTVTPLILSPSQQTNCKYQLFVSAYTANFFTEVIADVSWNVFVHLE